MLNVRTIFAALILNVAALTAWAGFAQAAVTSVATANVNLRAGPSTAYPVIVTVPAGAGVVTLGCNAGYTWCDVSYRTYRGWVAASYLQTVYQGRTVVLTPAVAPVVGVTVVAYNRAYWDRYYAAYPWYGRWTAYPAGVAAVRSGTVVGPAGGTATGSAGCGPYGCGRAGTVTGVNGGTATGGAACGRYGCGRAGTVTGPGGNTVSGAGACGPRGCRGAAVGPNGTVRGGARLR